MSKHPKSVDINLRITVDKSKSSGCGSKKCKQKVKVEQITCEDGDDGGNQPNLSNQLPQYALIPSSKIFPCGCLIEYDRTNMDCNCAGVQCNSYRSSTQQKCWKGESSGTYCSGCHCQPSGQEDYHCVRVRKKNCCNQITPACQALHTYIPEAIQNSQVATQNVSVQAFQSQASMKLPPPSELVRSEPSSSKCSRAIMKNSKQSTVDASGESPQVIMAPSSVETGTSFRTVPPSPKSLQVVETPVPPSRKSSVVEIPVMSSGKQSEVVPPRFQVEGPMGPLEYSKLVSTKATQNAFMPLPSTGRAYQTGLEGLSMEETGVRIEGSRRGLGKTEFGVTIQASNADKDGISETPVGGVIIEDCAEEACEDVCEDEEEDVCFSLNGSSWKNWGWESWDKFISLMNGEPTCASTLCMETCCCEEGNAAGACTEGNGGRSTFGGEECGPPCDEGELCMADPIGLETYAVLLLLPLVFLGLMASFKTTC